MLEYKERNMVCKKAKGLQKYCTAVHLIKGLYFLLLSKALFDIQSILAFYLLITKILDLAGEE